MTSSTRYHHVHPALDPTPAPHPTPARHPALDPTPFSHALLFPLLYDIVPEYEVDFINNFTKLTSVGTTFNPEAYLTPEQALALKF
jgi:hypothetical protein